MDSEFWIDRWETGRIGFHRSEPSVELLENEALFLGGGAHRVFVPLCGKSVDLPWLRSRGHEIVGGELSELAVRALFDESGLVPIVSDVAPFRVFTADGITVWCGDVLALRPEHVGAIDRIWDRAALIALPLEIRVRYAAHLAALAPGAQMLLVTIDYDAGHTTGPPFAVSPDEIRDLYGSGVRTLSERDIVDAEPRWRAAGHEWVKGTVSTLRLPEP